MLGDEQYLDVELDRNTEFLPRREDVWEIDWFSDVPERRRIQDEPMKRIVESVPGESGMSFTY